MSIGLAGFLLVDHLLFAREMFRRAFGSATPEGQIRHKARQAHRFAEVADVVLFGSSMTRTGASSEPLLLRGVLPFNFAVSGGGPLYDFYALQSIAPELARRATKPTLLLELNEVSLGRETARGPERYTWSELEVFHGISRSRLETVRDLPRLFANFAAYGMASRFTSSAILPSGLYRQYTRGVIAWAGDLGDFFFGSEDCCGYAPLYEIGHSTWHAPDAPPLALNEVEPVKLDYLRSFLYLARKLGCPVVLVSRPTASLTSDEHRYDLVFAELGRGNPGLILLRPSQYGLDVADFADAHLNIWGADKYVNALADVLALTGDRALLAGKFDHLFTPVAVPDPAGWKVALASVPGSASPAWAATSPTIAVASEAEVLLEAELGPDAQPLVVRLDSLNPQGQPVGRSSSSQIVPSVRERRVFVRLRPSRPRMRLAIAWEGAPLPRLRILRAVQERP
jgi:hypothetical protein